MEVDVLLQFLYALDAHDMTTLLERNQRPLGVALVRAHDELEPLNGAAAEALDRVPELGALIGETVRRATTHAHGSAMATAERADEEWTILAIRLPHPIGGRRVSVVIGGRPAPKGPARP
jgi:hypothetical protein